MTAWAVYTRVHFPVAAQKQETCGTEGKHSEMNLYRSFGNLMEAWITEGSQCSHSEWLGNNDEDSPTTSSHMGTNLRSESVDSGVETASSDMSFLTTSCSVSTDNTEIDTFTPERGGDGLTQASIFSSPLPSSSSPSLSPSRALEGSTALHQKVEQALQKTHSKQLKDNPEPLTVDEVLRRQARATSQPLTVDEVLRRQARATSEPPTVDEVLRRQPRASFPPKRHASELVRGQRLESFGLRRMADPLVPMRHMHRRPMSMICDRLPAQTRLEALGEEDGKGLSPGLSYLEQVCQMLEEIARQQMHNQALQMEPNALREHQDMEPLDACQSHSQAADEDPSSCGRLENKDRAEISSSEPQRRKDYHRHFRQRSASDTTIATLHLRKLNADCRGQHLSTDDLWEAIEEDHNKQEPKKEETNKMNKNWKFKIGSLGRDESLSDIKGQQMQSSEKNWARRRLSQLFGRNRRKTLPV